MNETIVKYLAGLFDADGSISFAFTALKPDGSSYMCRLGLEISSSEAIDRHGFIASLPELTGFGSVNFRYHKGEQTHSSNRFVRWSVQSRRDIEMLIPRLIKHSCVKARHMQRMLDKWKEKRGDILSAAECDELRNFSKQSRCDSGPIKSKNYPTWSWLSGYIDGNGTLDFAKYKSQGGRQTCRISLTCHIGDVRVLEFVQNAHGGYIIPHGTNENCMVWKRSLGARDRSFALRFLPKIVQHIKIKRHRIEQMLSFHHQHRLSEQTPEGDATVRPRNSGGRSNAPVD
jgi:hypothetical protein